MTEQLQHDPRTKQQIKEAIYAFLYAPIEKQFKHRLDGLIIRNAVFCGYSHKSFMFKNVLYNCDTNPLPRKMNRLDAQFHGEMADLLKEQKDINEKEMPFVLGYINQVLNSSNDLHDYLRLLPQAVHGPVEALIATCPCRGRKLPDEAVDILQKKNQNPIELMKQRMVTNLLI
jgi:hypothetical protein